MVIKSAVTYLIRGILAILVGSCLLLFRHPAVVLTSFLLAGYFLVEGLVACIVGTGKTEAGKTRWFLMGGGIISLCWAVLTFIIGGVLSTIFPRISEVLLLYLVFSRAFLIGFFEVLAAVVRREAGAVALRLTMGVVSVVFAIVMIATNIETSSPLTLLRPFAIFCVIIGITLLLVSFAVRSQLRKRVSAIA